MRTPTENSLILSAIIASRARISAQIDAPNLTAAFGGNAPNQQDEDLYVHVWSANFRAACEAEREKELERQETEVAKSGRA